jgi:Arc/MetJ family transcription regulator
MKTTLDLPDELMEEAMQAVNLKTTSEVVILALHELIKRNKVASIRDYKGKVSLDMDLDRLRNRNANPG